MSLISIFIPKYQFDPSIYFISIWSVFWKFWCNQVIFVSRTLTTLKECHVLVPEFFELFLNFLKKKKKLPSEATW